MTAQQLRSLGALLLDIHGQNDGRQLLDEARHQDYLDRFAGIDAEMADYTAAYNAWRGLKREIARLSMDEMEKARLTETLDAEVRELEAAKITPGEEEELTRRRDRMKNAEKLTEAVGGAYGALYESDGSAIALAGADRRPAEAGPEGRGRKDQGRSRRPGRGGGAPDCLGRRHGPGAAGGLRERGPGPLPA